MILLLLLLSLLLLFVIIFALLPCITMILTNYYKVLCQKNYKVKLHHCNNNLTGLTGLSEYGKL